VNFYMEATGIKRSCIRMRRLSRRRVETEPAMQKVADEMMHAIAANFQSQGRRSGGSWKKDTSKWAEQKVKRGLDPRIGHATLALRISMTVRDSDHQRLYVDHNTVALGSDLPYAESAQRHRPFVKFTRGDKTKFKLIIQRYLIAAWNGSVSE